MVDENIIETNQDAPKFDNELIYETSKEAQLRDDGQGAGKKCGACERTGFPLLLVRKSIVPKYFKKEIDWSKGMLALGSDREPKDELTLHKYVYRTLREGYVYILLKKKATAPIWQGTKINLLKIMAYEVTNSGAFRLRELNDIKGSRPKELPQSCMTERHHLKAKFITIDNKIYDEAWIAYSPYRWEKETLQFYRDNDKERNLRFTIVDLQKADPFAQTAQYQQRSFPIADFIQKNRYLLELECDNNEVIDYFDEKQQTQFRKKILDDKLDTSTKVTKEIEKGVFYAKNIDLNDLAMNSTEEILTNFDSLFCTASHFNSLRQKEGQAVAEFDTTINNYKASTDNQLNKYYQTDDISVVMVEDCLGLAEELSVQRRQLLAPIVKGLVGSSQEQAQAIQKKLNLKLEDKTNTTINELIVADAPLMQGVNPDIADAFYQENILDLKYNQHYKAIHQYSSALRFVNPATSWLTQKVSQGLASLFGARSEAIVNYFNGQIGLAPTRPLLYFQPETQFARHQYKNIDNYKDILQSNILSQDGSGSDCIIFAFYSSSQFSSIGEKFLERDKERAKERAEKIYTNPFGVSNKDKIFLDSISVDDVIGDKCYAKEYNFPIFDPPYESAYDKALKYYYFRHVSEIGFSNMNNYSPPLGDYERIEITEGQKKRILALYNSTNKYGIPLDEVVVVRYPNAKLMVAKWKKEKQWQQKEGKRSNKRSISQYEQLDKITYDNVITYAKTVSQDYFSYLLWLFDENNNVKFWLKENDPDTSDIHINALSNLLMILDSSYLGNIYLEQQSQLWAKLLNSQSSPYFHLIEGNPYSLFNVAAGNVSPEDEQLTQQVKSILAKQLSEQPTGKTSTKVDNPLSGVKSAIAKSKFITNLKLDNNVKVGAYLKEELIKLSLNSFAKSLSHNNTYNINREVVNLHLVKAMNMFSTGTFKEYKVSVPVSSITNFLDNLGDAAPIVLPKGGRLITSGGTKIKAHNSATNNGYVLGKNDLAKASGQAVEFTMVMTFPDEKARTDFETGLQSNKGYAKPEKFIGASVIQFEELQAAKYQAEKKWRAEVYDTSISGAMNAFTLVYQHIQLNLLQERLQTLNDQVLIDKLSVQLTKTYINIALTTAESTLTVLKFMALFGERDKTLYELFKKTGKGLSYIGKTIAIIDSFSDLCQASVALQRGDTGSFGFMITSTISLVAAGIGIVLSISLPWTIVLFLAPYVINFIFGTYDDGSGWDEMDKWVNRSIFGLFDRNDLFPPYPISDTGNYLSEQDYYLASRKGFCKLIKYEVEKDAMARTIAGVPVQDFSKPNQYDLYLNMQLPDFIEEKAKFEGMITIRHKDQQPDTILTISDGDNAVTIETDTKRFNTTYFMLPNNQMISKDKSDVIYSYFQAQAQDSNNDAGLDKFKQSWLAMQQVITPQPVLANPQPEVDEVSTVVAEPNIGLFQINQWVGRITGEFELICTVKYWPEGKTNSEGQPLFPFLLSYQYNVLTLEQEGDNNITDINASDK